MSTPERTHTLLAGLTLIIAPILAITLKALVYPGWMMFVIILAGIPLLLGYALQIVVAANGMLRARGVFNQVAGTGRGLIAAWVTSIGILLTAFFLVDGGDDGTFGSAFTLLTGTSSTGAGEQLSNTLMLFAAFAWIAGWIWLVVEWIGCLAQRRRAKVTE